MNDKTDKAIKPTNKTLQHGIDNFPTEISNIDWVNKTTMEISWDKSIYYQSQCRFLKIVENKYMSAGRPENPITGTESNLYL